MSIGIAAVILILSLSAGISNYVNEVLIDDDSLRLEIETEDEEGFSNAEIRNIKNLDGVSTAEASTISRNNVFYSYECIGGTLLTLTAAEGALPEALYGSTPSEGGLYVNEALAEELCSEDESAEDAVGKTVLLSMGEGESISLAVSGVYEDSSSYSQFCSAYAEKSVLEALYASAERDMPNNRLIVSVESSSYLSAVREDLETLGYTVTGENASLGDIMSYIDLGTMVLTAVGGISLVVSAIMIFIVLYISVIERTKEIGVLRAIGGSKGNIKTVFLFEAGFLGAIAGGIAVALSLLIAVIVNVSTASLGVNIVAYSYGLYYFAGLALSILLSVCAGIAPASYAAALDPVESLRRE